ncbi:MAG: hypothetical protein QOG68_22, partial [Solirubrobacteraceae bacterium]|nr:hypothetical protein [Solirubrobacteraceae bacterium]
AGYAPASRLAGGLSEIVVAQGSTAVENPTGIVTHYGYENDTPSPDNAALPQMVPANLASPAEAQKTEPDKNTYLVFKNGLPGADQTYDYGTEFLFQGHENGAGSPKQGFLTRINLDADATHRVTVLATKDDKGNPIATIDGSTWDPWAQRLLLTTENTSAPTYAATPGYPSTVEDVSGALGRGGYEGIQNDSDGNLWIVEDIGGSNKPGTTAKAPNSYIYRYVPAKPGDLHNGRLQALQVLNVHGQPITFASQSGLNGPDQLALHSYGNTFATRWVHVHDTATDGNAPFVANPLARAAGATPFKRPENGVFRPGTKFGEFFFTETGDTNATSAENGSVAGGDGGAGGWGGLFRLSQSSPSASTGRLSLFWRGNQAVTGLDNIQFLSANLLTAVEDAGDALHSQRNALDSGYVFDASRSDYAGTTNPPRWLAEGRDPSATLDSANGGFGKNDGDNEITGVHVSDGSTGTNGVLGAGKPSLADGRWRWFYTEQHGDNRTFEVVPTAKRDHSGD